MIYAIDKTNSLFKSDVRLETLYRVLDNKHIPYTEIFHTVPGRETLLNFFKRKRPSLYLESFYILFRPLSSLGFIKSTNTDFINKINLSSFNNEEKKLVKNILIRYTQKIHMSRLSVVVLRKVLSFTNLKVLFSIEDPRSYNEIIVAARLENIKTYALQHGHFTEYHIGWRKDDSFLGKIVAPDMLLVWSIYWKDELKRLNSVFPQEKIIVGGIKKALPIMSESLTSLSESIVVLIPYEAESPKQEVVFYIKKMLNCPNVLIIFKLRPGVSKEQQLAEYNLKEGFHDRFSTTFDITAVIHKVDIVAGVYSTLLYDAIAYPKRVAVFNTSSDYGRGIVTNGLADMLNNTGDICTQLKEIRRIPKGIITKRKEKLYDTKPVFLEETLIRIMKEEYLL